MSFHLESATMNRTWFVPETLIIKATNISLVTDSSTGGTGLTINGKTLSGASAAQVTGAIALNSGAVVTFSTRGVASAQPILQYILSPGTGTGATAIPPKVVLNIPKCSVDSFTGTPNQMTIGQLPAGVRPLLQPQQRSVIVLSNGIQVNGQLTIGTDGTIVLGLVGGGNLNTSLGLQQDLTLEFIETAV